jgi:hypothetical protein
MGKDGGTNRERPAVHGADPKTTTNTGQATWHAIVQRTLKQNDVTLVVYVPDKVFTRLIKSLHADPDFKTFAAAREEEAVGILAGAWMGGQRGAVLMQTSGFGTIPNALASLAVPYQIPLIMFVSERGTLGEFNLGQAWYAGPCGRCSTRSGSRPTPSRAWTSSHSSSTARSSRRWRRRRRSPSSSRRCSPAARSSRRERDDDDADGYRIAGLRGQ